MARLNIEHFTKKEVDSGRLHDIAIATYSTFKVGGEPILQVDMYGSPMRKTPGGKSQLIQIDKEVAKKLLELFRAHHMLD